MMPSALKKYTGRLILMLLALQLIACATPLQPVPDDPEWAPVFVDPLQPQTTSTKSGAIPQSAFGLALFSDRKAAQVGDILTVILSERTTSSKSAETSVTKESAIDFDQGLVLGDDVTFGDYNFETEVNQNRDFEGEAESDQSNSLQGSIAVTVIGVYPNGNLAVRGEKWMKLNRGDEFIRIRGIVRAQDISSENSVLSTQLADARLTYSGTGALANSNNMGWAGKFFNSPLWPF